MDYMIIGSHRDQGPPRRPTPTCGWRRLGGLWGKALKPPVREESGETKYSPNWEVIGIQ